MPIILVVGERREISTAKKEICLKLGMSCENMVRRVHVEGARLQQPRLPPTRTTSSI